MLLKALLIFPYILCSFPQHAAAGPMFLVTSPLDIRPGLNVTLGITLFEESPPLVKVTAEILKDNVILLEDEGIYQQGSTGTLVLSEIPLNSVNGKYQLHVKGYSKGQVIFSNMTSLDFKSKSFSVFIQTNSVIYKPAQEVNIRILVFSVDLKPYTSTIDIHILDPRGNLIEQWLEEEADLGVVSRSFYLSEHPPLGDWSIKVKLHQQLHYQTFQVMEYVLPRFEVLLTTPIYHSMKNEELEGTVTAKYTYGKPVNGVLTAILLHTATYKRKNNITKTFEIDGYAQIQYIKSELEELMASDTSSFTGPVDLLVIVTDSLTGLSQNQTTSIYVINKVYYSEFFGYPTVLKPTLNFTASIKILRYDGRQLTSKERRNEVKITVTQSRMFLFGKPSADDFDNPEDIIPEEGRTILKEQLLYYSVPENRIIHIEVPLLANTTHLKVKAEFLDSVNHLFINDVFNSPSKTYLQIKNINQDIKVGIPFNLDIESNIPLPEIHYMVMSRGQIVSVGKENSMTITLNPGIVWMPSSCVIVYHVARDGTIINDVTTLSIQPIFENQISLSWSKTQAKPSEKVSLIVTVPEPNSIVGLSVIDKSVKLLGQRQDITTNHVVEELSDYSKAYVRQIISPSEVFERCNMWVITDANLAHDDNIKMWYTQLEDTMEEMPRPWIPVDLSNTHIRSHFPETWIWKDIKMGSKTSFVLEAEVPDSITSWVTNAFVMSETLGLGILSAPVQLEAFQPFFVSLNLPNSITLGEKLILEIFVFNYLEEDIEVLVTLSYSKDFDIKISSIATTGFPQNVSVPSQEGKTVYYPIVPNKLGKIPIIVKAESSLAADIVSQNLSVKAEGIEHSHSETLLLELFNNKPQTILKPLDFTFPPDVVSGSEKAFITVVGNILGPSLASIDSLIQLPSGCGEQNMIKFAPIIMIMEYLTNTKQLTGDSAYKLVSYMKEGYQRELTYQREDGSFSAFGNGDSSGSTWLSAFVLRCFLRARAFILVDPVVLHNTLTWLLKHQKKNGEFWEPGRIINKQIQGGLNSPVSLTAYIMSALIEYPGLMNSSQIATATDYLESQMNDVISDNYTLSLVTYALSLVGRSKAVEGLDILNTRAERKGDLRFWKSPTPEVSGWWQASSGDIMTASYVLLSHVIQNRVAEGIPVMKWLSQQRNHLGGFSSTQDTVVALQALSSFASMYTFSKTALTISVDGNHMNSSISFMINPENHMLLQNKQVTVGQPMKFKISAEGVGFAMLQLNIIYNVKSSTSRKRRSVQNQEPFDLSITVYDKDENINAVNLSICTRYLDKDAPHQSGMILMQVDLLSGFILSPESLLPIYPVKKVESGNGQVNIYFDSLNETQVCVHIPTTSDSRIGNTKDAFVSVIDYYEPRRRTVRNYNSQMLKKRSLCSYCKDECNTCIEDSGTVGFQQHSATKCLFMIMLILQFILL
ncbi:CD109 antigen-like [Discoglossus pictus]